VAAEVPDGSFGCGQCWPPDAAAAWEARGSLTPRSSLIDDLHLGVTLVGCPTCNQQFVSVFLEFVDWADGDDPQYWTVLPLTEPEVAELAGLDRPSLIAKLNGTDRGRRCLQRDYPKGESVRLSWGTGIWIAG
jgi:hypothetical protein